MSSMGVAAVMARPRPVTKGGSGVAAEDVRVEEVREGSRDG